MTPSQDTSPESIATWIDKHMAKAPMLPLRVDEMDAVQVEIFNVAAYHCGFIQFLRASIPETEKSMSKHTPTPWEVADEADFMHRIDIRPIYEGPPKFGSWSAVAQCEEDFGDYENGEGRANAEFIVRAVNAHDALIAGLQEIIERSNVDPLGSGKVTDMRRIAAKLLEKHGGAA